MRMLTKFKSWRAIFALLLLVLCSGKSWGQEVSDEFTYESFTATGTSYTEFSGVQGASGAVYAGKSATTKQTIQLRSKNSDCGIVTTTSGGRRVKSIIVEWYSETPNGRELDIYGKTSAYSSATDLYATATRGDKLGSIPKGRTELTINGDYTYIGLRSKDGALYLNKLTIVWEQGEQTQVSAPVFSPASGTNFIDQLTVTASCATDGATIYYTTDGTTPTAESDEFPVEGLPITETTTLKAMAVADGLDNSDVAEATYTKENVYSVAQAQAVIESGSMPETPVYVKGIITEIGEVSAQYGNASYYINDTQTQDGQLYVFRGRYLNNESFTDENQIKVGDEVVVCGTLVLYSGNTPEISDSYIYSLTSTGLPSPTFAWSTVAFTADINAQSVSYPVLTNNSDGAVSYESSATDVATIDATTGAITLVAVGKTTITARVAATENYSEASASYTLTVVDPSALGEPVAFVGERDGGDYAMMNSLRGSNKLYAQAVVIVNDKVISPENVDMISWYADESRGTIQNAAGEYVAYVSGTDIKLQSQSFKWTVSDGMWTAPDDKNSNTIRALGVNKTDDEYYIGAYNSTDDDYPKVRMMPIVDGYTRTVTAGTYGTICLPYAVAAEDLAGAEFFNIAGKVTGTDGKVNYLVLDAVTELEAGKPYIFSATSDMLLAAYNGEAVAEAASDNGLTGTFTEQDVAEGMYMITDNTVQLCGTGCSIAANRAYINMGEVAEYTESVGVNQRMLPLDGGTTGIETVEAAEADALVNVYTLSGVEVRHQVRAAEATDGLQRGIYIVNGKKMVVK